MKSTILLLALLFAPILARAQSSALVAVPNAQINWCAYPANAVPCTNYAPTYSSSTLLTQCPSNAPIVLQGSSTCQASSDNFGNLGVWAPPGKYSYTMTVGGQSYGPFTVSLGALPNPNVVPVENFGAIGDWNGTTGTDNTTAIQACLNTVVGLCQLQAASYKTTAALSITRSNVGIVGATFSSTNNALYPTSGLSPSQIVQTCASCDIVDVSGTSNFNAIAFNTFRNFTLSRSVAATGSAKGLSLVFVDGPVVDGVASQDSIVNVYLKGIASQVGRIENSIATWGFTGQAEPAGNLYGFEIDSTDGSTSNSLRIRNIVVASNYAHTGTSTTYGIYETGSQIHDLHLQHPETAGTDYGIFLNSTVPTLGPSLDIQIVDPILDSCSIECFVANQAAGTISVTGGWMAAVNPAVTDVLIEGGSTNVSFVNTSFFCDSTVMTTCFSATGSNLIQLVGNKFPAPFTLTTLIGFASVVNGVISGNILNGIATNGIVLDANTHGIVGLETNVCSAVYGAITNCLVDNGGNQLILTPRLFSRLPACSAGFEGSIAPVTDSTTATYNATITGGGANHVKAYCNGTNWVAQ